MTMASASTCGDIWSTDAASRNISVASRPGAVKHLDHDRPPHSEGAGLVHHQSRCVPKVFQRAAAANHHTLT